MKVFFISNSLFFLAALSLTGCASLQSHEHARGSVVALDSPTQAHVCMSSKEVQTGDQVSIFESVCTSKKKKSSKYSEESQVTTCTKVLRGEGEITESADPHFVKVKALADLTFKEGYIVEKSLR